jgi:hypothetical protein
MIKLEQQIIGDTSIYGNVITLGEARKSGYLIPQALRYFDDNTLGIRLCCTIHSVHHSQFMPLLFNNEYILKLKGDDINV